MWIQVPLGMTPPSFSETVPRTNDRRVAPDPVLHAPTQYDWLWSLPTMLRQGALAHGSSVSTQAAMVMALVGFSAGLSGICSQPLLAPAVPSPAKAVHRPKGCAESAAGTPR